MEVCTKRGQVQSLFTPRGWNNSPSWLGGRGGTEEGGEEVEGGRKRDKVGGMKEKEKGKKERERKKRGRKEGEITSGVCNPQSVLTQSRWPGACGPELGC